jgi:hypothetical protein
MFPQFLFIRFLLGVSWSKTMARRFAPRLTRPTLSNPVASAYKAGENMQPEQGKNGGHARPWSIHLPVFPTARRVASTAVLEARTRHRTCPRPSRWYELQKKCSRFTVPGACTYNPDPSSPVGHHESMTPIGGGTPVLIGGRTQLHHESDRSIGIFYSTRGRLDQPSK